VQTEVRKNTQKSRMSWFSAPRWSAWPSSSTPTPSTRTCWPR